MFHLSFISNKNKQQLYIFILIVFFISETSNMKEKNTLIGRENKMRLANFFNDLL